jgi:hypothetical protein
MVRSRKPKTKLKIRIQMKYVEGTAVVGINLPEGANEWECDYNDVTRSDIDGAENGRS